MISIIIPCHNRLDPLSFVLAGFCRQRQAPAFEILLIDNNSTADIAALHSQYSSDLDLKLLRMPELTSPYALCRARNRGLQLARYPWIVTLDSDCVPNDNYMNALAQYSQKDSLLLVGERVFCSVAGQDVGAFRRREVHHESWPRIRSLSNYHELIDRRLPHMAQLSKDHPHPWDYAHGGNCAFRREDAIHIGGFDESYDGCWGHEDIDFAYRLVQQVDTSIVYDPGLVTHHAESVLDEPDPQRMKEMMEKTSNRNWNRITRQIPGFKEYKTSQYATISSKISV